VTPSGATTVTLLNQAKNKAGNNAVEAAKLGNYRKRNEWQAIAAAISELERRAIQEMAR
jgi:hypothetical protein